MTGLQYSREPLTLQERIWLHRIEQTGDPEALLCLLSSRILSPITPQELLHMPGAILDGVVAQCADAMAEAASGKALIEKHGLQ